MDFENFNELPKQPELEKQTTTEAKPETRFDDLPKLEDLLKSENEVNTVQAPELKGLKQVDENSKTIEKTFVRKEDERRTFVKRRVKIFTCVYVAVFTLLLGFVIANTATLSILSSNTSALTQQIETGSYYVQNANSNITSDEVNAIEISVNTPRDYGDDDTDLTFLDKLSILFRSLFG